jgi:hypothetical protein
MGFIPVNGDEALSVAVLLEDTPDAGEAAALGGQILQTAINAR